MASATAGLCFKDPAESIIHYYDAMKAAGAEVIVVLSHLGFDRWRLWLWHPVYGDKTSSSKLNTAGKPVNLIIGGHSHTNLSAATTVGTTVVAQAHYNGRKVGRADITVSATGAVSVTWTRLWVCAANNTATPCYWGAHPRRYHHQGPDHHLLQRSRLPGVDQHRDRLDQCADRTEL